jgi:hypothetical protein
MEHELSTIFTFLKDFGNYAFVGGIFSQQCQIKTRNTEHSIFPAIIVVQYGKREGFVHVNIIQQDVMN